ncbi:MAG: M20/M25/M40 family metallo-hydrolase [Gracilimonas sp.]|uniref:M28 family metallopeptidase n=1 Tax=Gracilimonas sp. TaxID=1974203 RepID=UPI0019C83A29|nr:M28 family metallopeptidase [Gracilimonas sp.]MBD3615564.1 M20/M25/M40 family metallo-hydrolase [Gracilimonas sp.]
MKLLTAFLIFAFSVITYPVSSQSVLSPNHKENVRQLIHMAMDNDLAWDRLTYMADTFGPRFSGSENLENAMDWIVETMKDDGFDKVWTQPVMVPHWVRGKESASLISPRKKNLPMLSMGGSIATPEGGITAEVIVVKSFEELEQVKERVEGKIVLYNAEFTSYGRTVQYRMNGASEAAKHGAVASIIRSVGPYSMQTPHTGTMNYEEGVKKIPHAAITIEDAMMIQRLYDRGESIKIHLELNAQTLPDTESRNVIAEIKGTEFPEEIIVLGGHIDSWDVGQGVMDDGGGSIAAWEAVRLMNELGIKPKRTIRVVLWTNEENGLRGANEYHRWVKNEEKSLDNHVLAIESDAGVFDPVGFGFSGSDQAYEILTEIGSTLKPIESGEVTKGGGGADIGPLMQDGVPGMGLVVDGTRYFWYHHTAADTMDKLDKDDFNECVATMAVFAYAVADLEERLPR